MLIGGGQPVGDLPASRSTADQVGHHLPHQSSAGQRPAGEPVQLPLIEMNLVGRLHQAQIFLGFHRDKEDRQLGAQVGPGLREGLGRLPYPLRSSIRDQADHRSDRVTSQPTDPFPSQIGDRQGSPDV